MPRRADAWRNGIGPVRRGVPVRLLAALLLAGCAGDRSSGPLRAEPPTAGSLAGSWTLSVPATATCSPELPDMELILEIEPVHVAGSPHAETRDYLAGRWGRAGEPAEEWLQGWVELASGRVHLLLWQGVHVTGSVLDLRRLSEHVLGGRLSEPVPAGEGGYAEPSESYPGGFTDGDCDWRVTARR